MNKEEEYFEISSFTIGKIILILLLVVFGLFEIYQENKDYIFEKTSIASNDYLQIVEYCPSPNPNETNYLCTINMLEVSKETLKKCSHMRVYNNGTNECRGNYENE